MRRRKFLFLSAGAAALGWAGWRGHSSATLRSLVSQGALRRIARRGRALGTEVTITVYHRDALTAERGIAAAYAAIDRVEDLMSLYREQSQLTRLNRAGRLLSPDSDLLRVLRFAGEVTVRTGGAFDVTVQPLWQCYRAAATQARLPSAAEREAAVSRVGWQEVWLTDEAIGFGRPGMAITLNGLAQGFAADAAAAALRAEGIEHALIDSGEFGVVGSKPGAPDWRIGLRHPRQTDGLLGLSEPQGRCLATSGDYETTFSPDFRCHHLLDPHTGQSPEELAGVSVLAPTALAADAWSTAFCLIGRERSERLLEDLPGVDALFVDKAGRVARTAGFPLVPMT